MKKAIKALIGIAGTLAVFCGFFVLTLEANTMLAQLRSLGVGAALVLAGVIAWAAIGGDDNELRYLD